MNERRKHSNKRIWVFAALCALLLLSLAGAAGAIFSAVGLEQTPQCGMAEHRHSESCYLGDVLICGEKDAAGSACDYNKRWAATENLDLHWIAGTGHNSNTDKPDEVNALIKGFWNRVR